MDPDCHIQHMEETYGEFFGEKMRGKERSNLVKGVHLKLDTSAFLDKEDMEIY